MGKFFSFVHMGKSYISKVPIGPEVSKTNLGTGPGPCKKCGLGPGPGGPLIAGHVAQCTLRKLLHFKKGAHANDESLTKVVDFW